jgi:membrane protease YdiL (CAAX protease family)
MVVWTGLVAIIVALGTAGIWTGLLASNLRSNPAIPWSVGVMALILWVLWQYLGGRWAPRRTAAARRAALRARPLPRPVLAWAIGAGLLALVALAGFWVVLVRLVAVPAHALPDYTRYPPLTVALVLAMAALAGGVTEEAGFRGYFQGALERTVGGPAAILIAAAVMAPAHAMTQGFVWPIVLFYLCVDAMLGMTAYLTQSILPGLVTHSLGLLTFFALIWPRDPARRLVWDGGADPWFWLHSGQALLFAALALLAFRRLAGMTARRRAGPDDRGVPALAGEPAE